MLAVWRFYELEDECRPAAKCKVCKLMVSRGGSIRASYNTTNLIRHLKKHEAEYKEYSAATKSKAGLKQQMLLASLRKDKFPRGGEKARMITQRLTEFIALDDQPISVVENTGFRRLLEFLEPRYELPSRHFITSTAIPELYNKVRTHVRDLLSDGAAVSFTTDLWTSDVCPMSLLSLTAHWINATFEMKQAVLHANEFRSAHTADNVRQAISDMLQEWGLEKQRVHVILRDNARNMKKAMDDMGVPSLGRVAHTLQLIVHEGVLSQRSVSNTLANARKIVGHFKHSAQSYTRLQDIQIELKMPKKCLQQDVQVR